MTVLAFEEGDLFTFTVTKYLATNPDNVWENRYEFEALAASGESELLGLGGILVNFESVFHLDSVVFSRLLISTWTPDSVPYNPEAFVSTSLTAVGATESGSNPLGLSNCLSVTRQARSGRFGHIFYRGVLTEDVVQAPAGKTILNDRAATQGVLDGAVESSGLDAYLGTSPTAALHMVMVSADGSQIRGVTGLFVQGVAQVKADHKWFNRRTIVVP